MPTRTRSAKPKWGTRAHARLRVAALCDSGKRLRESRAWPPVQTFGRKNGAALIDISYFLCIVFRISCAIRSLPDATSQDSQLWAKMREVAGWVTARSRTDDASLSDKRGRDTREGGRRQRCNKNAEVGEGRKAKATEGRPTPPVADGFRRCITCAAMAQGRGKE